MLKNMMHFFQSKRKLMEHEFNFFKVQKAQKKREFNFSCNFITLTTHDFHFCFACLKRLHNIQSNILQTEKHARYFLHEKWIHYMGGKRFALVRALWARPPYNEFIFHENKNYFYIFFNLEKAGLNVV